MYIGSLRKGGAERVMSNLADFFFEQGYKVTLVTTYLALDEYEVAHAAWKRVPAGAEGAELVADTEENDVWVDPRGGEKGGIDRVFSALLRSEQKGRVYNLRMRSEKLRRIWEKLKPDLILSFIGKNNIMALSTAGKRDIRVVVSVRADPVMEYDSLGLKAGMLASFGRAAGIIVQSEGAKKYFPSYIQKKCVILPNSINPSFIRERFKGEREKTIVMVGRLDENKNQAMVMRCFARIREKGFEDYRLVIYGDGPDRLKLTHFAEKLGLGSSIEFRGMVRHVAEHIEKASLYILASNQEGMPNSLIEAMALGLPCISTDCPCGGPADLIENGVNGILVPVGDEKEMTKAMKRILRDSEFANTLGENASALKEKYSPEVTNRKWKDYLDGIMSGVSR